MRILLLSFTVPLLLCFGSVFVCANGVNSTRKTLFEAWGDVHISVEAIEKYRDHVNSYSYPTLAEVEGVMVTVVEARFDHYLSVYRGEVLAKYSMGQGGRGKTMVAIPRKRRLDYARSVNPTVVQHNKNLFIFAERFEEWNYDSTDYKSGKGDFVRSLSYRVRDSKGKPKRILAINNTISLIDKLKSEMQRLQVRRLVGGLGRGIEVNQTTIVPVSLLKNTKRYSSVLLSNSSNWKLSQGTGDPGTFESVVVEWEGKLIMNARTDDGYCKVYESTDMGDTWKEASGSLFRVWGNSPKRHGIGCSASLIIVNIENTSVMLFSHPMNTKEGKYQDQLRLWLTDNKRIYDVGQISARDEYTGHSSLLYTKGNLYCVYEKDKDGTQKYYSSVLAHLVDELYKIKYVVKIWKKRDMAFSEPCDEKDPNPSYPGSTCEVHIPQKGLVGFLSFKVVHDKWKDAYGCVDAVIKNGVMVKNGIKFNSNGAGAMWPVGKQGQNQRYHFMNHEFILAAIVIIHESTATNTTPLVSVLLDTNDHKTIIDGGHIITGNSSIKEHELKEWLATLATDKPVRLVLTFQNGIVKLYL